MTKGLPSIRSDFGSLLTASGRLVGFLSLVAVFTPIHFIYTAFKPEDPFRIPKIFHRLLVRLLGFNVRVHGVMASSEPVLFVANHSSYLDIPILGALIPASFIAKAEVARWPLFGMMAKLQHTVFIERQAVRTRDQKNGMRARLDQGHNLILFPEGTSSDGLYVLPFRSGLFATVEEMIQERHIMVQPISITCTELDGLPITRAWRPYYAWYGDMTLVGHLWNVFKLGRFTIDVMFHPPVAPAAFKDRKALAHWCWQQVSNGVEQCMTGRNLAPPATSISSEATNTLAEGTP